MLRSPLKNAEKPPNKRRYYIDLLKPTWAEITRSPYIIGGIDWGAPRPGIADRIRETRAEAMIFDEELDFTDNGLVDRMAAEGAGRMTVKQIERLRAEMMNEPVNPPRTINWQTREDIGVGAGNREAIDRTPPRVYMNANQAAPAMTDAQFFDTMYGQRVPAGMDPEEFGRQIVEQRRMQNEIDRTEENVRGEQIRADARGRIYDEDRDRVIRERRERRREEDRQQREQTVNLENDRLWFSVAGTPTPPYTNMSGT